MTKEDEEFINNSRQVVLMNEDMNKWMQHCLEQGRLTTPDGAFAAGWRAAFMHRLGNMMEANFGFRCTSCGHEFHITIPILRPKEQKRED